MTAIKAGDPKWAAKELFTTGEAAEICKVSQQTIIRCFDTGRLLGFRLPGSRFRKIPRHELLRFMITNDIPTDALESTAWRILVAADDPALLDQINARLDGDDRFDLRIARTAYDAGLLTEHLRPHLIVLDSALPGLDAELVLRRVAENPTLKRTRVLLVASPDEAQGAGRTAGLDVLIETRPVDVDRLVPQMVEALRR